MATVDDVALRAETLGPLINCLSIIFVVISTVGVALRLYTRKCMLNAVGSDDVTVTVAQVLAIVVSVTTCMGKSSQGGFKFTSTSTEKIVEVKWGLGRHTKFVDPADAIKQLKVSSQYATLGIRTLTTDYSVFTPTS